mgnify:CR=1 FL=1
MDYNVLRRRDFAGGLTDEALKIRIQDDLARDGWTLLRGFQPDMAGFAGLVGRLCRRVTFDPARSLFIDDTLPILRSAQAFGVGHLLAVKEPDSKKGPKDTGEFAAVGDYRDLIVGL